jgi:hypothetical protein
MKEQIYKFFIGVGISTLYVGVNGIIYKSSEYMKLKSLQRIK